MGWPELDCIRMMPRGQSHKKGSYHIQSQLEIEGELRALRVCVSSLVLTYLDLETPCGMQHKLPQYTTPRRIGSPLNFENIKDDIEEKQHTSHIFPDSLTTTTKQVNEPLIPKFHLDCKVGFPLSQHL